MLSISKEDFSSSLLDTLRYYSQNDTFIPYGVVAIDRMEKTWRLTSFDIGGQSGEERGIDIAIAGPNARQLLDYFQTASRSHCERGLIEVFCNEDCKKTCHRANEIKKRIRKGKYNNYFPILPLCNSLRLYYVPSESNSQENHDKHNRDLLRTLLSNTNMEFHLEESPYL